MERTALETVEAVTVINKSKEVYVARDAGSIAFLIDSIQAWGIKRNITAAGGATALAQIKKLREEIDELEAALIAQDSHEIKDGVGDALTVLVQICRLESLTFDECLAQAWHDIKDRKGKMVDGVFVKEIV